MIQIGGLSTFSPRAALRMRSFFNLANSGIFLRVKYEREDGGVGYRYVRVSFFPKPIEEIRPDLA